MSKLQSCPPEILSHIVRFIVLDYKKIDTKKERMSALKTIHNWQSTCKLFERCEFINDFWWSVFERESGYILPNPSIQDQSQKLKKTLIEKGQLKKNILMFLKCIHLECLKKDPPEEIDEIKLAVLGGPSVGKTSLIDRYIHDDLKSKSKKESSYRKRVRIDNMNINVDIQDTAGSGYRNEFRDQFIKDGNCFMIVSSVDERNSLTDLTEIMNQCHRLKLSKDIPCLLVLNKIDMDPAMTGSILTIEPLKGIEQFQTPSMIPHEVMLASATTGQNVNECFEEIIRMRMRGIASDFKHYEMMVLNPGDYLPKAEKKCQLM